MYVFCRLVLVNGTMGIYFQVSFGGNFNIHYFKCGFNFLDFSLLYFIESNVDSKYMIRYMSPCVCNLRVTSTRYVASTSEQI